MPLNDRDYVRGSHPPACTCVGCSARRSGFRLGRIVWRGRDISPSAPSVNTSTRYFPQSSPKKSGKLKKTLGTVAVLAALAWIAWVGMGEWNHFRGACGEDPPCHPGDAIEVMLHRTKEIPHKIGGMWRNIEESRPGNQPESPQSSPPLLQVPASPTPAVAVLKEPPPIPAVKTVPTPSMTPLQVLALYDQGKITAEEAEALLASGASAPTPLGLLTYKGETDTELARRSRDILERVWKAKEVDKDLTVTYTHLPVYDPETDKFNLIGWDEASPGSATIVIPSTTNELTPGAVYASTFMVVTLQLAENPNSAQLEELQGIYGYATEDEYEEVLKCFEEVELIYCAIFIASYPTQETVIPTSLPPTVPTNTPKPSTERGSQDWVRQVESKIHILVNQERKKANLSSLANDADLSSIASAHSQDMATNDYFSHINLKGQDPTARATEANYGCIKDLGGGRYTDGIAENIAQSWTHSSTTYIGPAPIRNYMTMDQLANQLVHSWMTSPGHRQNILDKQYDRSGMGVALGKEEKVYATQNFC